MSDERDPASSASDHPPNGLVGILDAEETRRIRERVERFRGRLNEEVTS